MEKKETLMSSMSRGICIGSIMFLLVFFMGAVQLVAVGDDCRTTHPNPQIKFDKQDSAGRVYIPVINWSVYPNEMFRQAPELPPCGANANSARTWVEIYDAATNTKVYGFCALSSNSGLKGIWFHSVAKKGKVYIILNDRACKKRYKSNTVAWGIQDDCRKIPPNPQIKFNDRDSEGRVYIPVINWSVYPNEMFRKAPDLPPCGANANSSRTWVDIYNAATNARVYGFCSLGVNSDLQGIWFKSTAKAGSVYIVMIDRACNNRKYKSNTIKWPSGSRKVKTFKRGIKK